MKKLLLSALAALLVLAASVARCPAQADRTVANASKKGSLLIWPLVKATPADTVVKLNNEYYLGVKVRCAYRTPFPARHVDWVFELGPNQPLAWRVSTGRGPDGKALPQAGDPPPALPAGTSATLACWAVDDAGLQQLAWNWLTGDAVVGEGGARHWQYSAWRFAVNAATTGAAAGTAGRIRLTGDSGNYDTCPGSVSFDVAKQTPTPSGAFAPGTANNRLTLVPCAMDLRADGAVSAFTELQGRDESGGALAATSVVVGQATAATQWFSESLTSGKLRRAGPVNPFVRLATPRGMVLVHGRVSTADPGTLGVPLIGVLSMQFGSAGGPVANGTATTVGFGQGYLKDVNDAFTATPVDILW
jgi:hypothetical protein